MKWGLIGFQWEGYFFNATIRDDARAFRAAAPRLFDVYSNFQVGSRFRFVGSPFTNPPFSKETDIILVPNSQVSLVPSRLITLSKIFEDTWFVFFSWNKAVRLYLNTWSVPCKSRNRCLFVMWNLFVTLSPWHSKTIMQVTNIAQTCLNKDIHQIQ